MYDLPQIRIRACIAIVRDGKILLTPHFLESGVVDWHMPGGRIEFGETSRQAAERELEEETGYIGKAGEVIAVHDVIDPSRDYHGIAITFSGEITGGELRGEDHPVYGYKEAKWLSPDDLQQIKYDKPDVINQLLNIQS